jgi:hypothetical protein
MGQVYSSQGDGMKRLNLVAVFGLVVLAWLSVAAQDIAKPQKVPHAKTIRIAGKVSDDGTKFVDTNQNVWLVTNLETLKGYAGQEAILRGRIGLDTNAIQVLSIKRLVTYTANWSDSAFRR